MQSFFAPIARAVEFPDSVMYGVADVTYSLVGPAADAFKAAAHMVFPHTANALGGYFAAATHPLARRLPLMDAGYVVFGIVCYLTAIIALYPIGQMLGKLEMKSFGILHNFFLFALSAYMCCSVVITAIAAGFTLWNNGVDASNEFAWPMAKLSWLFYASKMPEFMDTVIMMLKHNYRQVSFLHLYHHSTIFVIWFWVVSEGPGGDAYFSAFLNSGVHVVMYGYYLGTLLSSSESRMRKFLNSIKFMITKAQMTQFALNLLQSVYLQWGARNLVYPRHLSQMLFVYMLTLLALFGNFLIKKHATAKNEKKKRAEEEARAAKKLA